MSFGQKTIDFSLCIVALYVKMFYPKQLGISSCMCISLKAYVILIRRRCIYGSFAVLMADNGSLFFLAKLLFKAHIYTIQK